MKKKKLIISSFDDITNPYYGGGGAVAVAEAADNLSKVFDVTVITGKYPGARDFNIGKVSYQRIGIGFANPKFSQITYTLLLPFHVIKGNFDLWVESFTPPFSTGLLQLLTKKPVIGLVHMLSGEDMSRKYLLPFHLFEAIGLKTYKYFIVTSKDVEAKIRRKNQRAIIKLIPNSVKKPNTTGLHNKKQILFLGRLEVNQKGIDLLIEAFKISGLHVNYKLILAGEGTTSEKIKIYKIINGLNLKGSVNLVGRVDGQKKYNLLAESEFMVVPSRFETFSLTCLEAISHGIPLITFKIDGLKWLPKNCRLSASPFSSKSLANNMSIMANQQQTREKLSDKGFIYSENFSVKNFAESYRNFLSAI